MGRMVREYRLETREARIRLKPRQNPYWRLISTNVHLAYRKGSRGGQWYYRVYHENEYIKRAFAEADDHADANGTTILSFAQAQEHARKEVHKIINGNDWHDKPYTVKDATTIMIITVFLFSKAKAENHDIYHLTKKVLNSLNN